MRILKGIEYNNIILIRIDRITVEKTNNYIKNLFVSISDPQYNTRACANLKKKKHL